jgi:hypothetical protein
VVGNHELQARAKEASTFEYVSPVTTETRCEWERGVTHVVGPGGWPRGRGARGRGTHVQLQAQLVSHFVKLISLRQCT